MMQEQTLLEGNKVIIHRNGHTEEHVFSTDEEARKRYLFITEALTWVGTPFQDCADIKGKNGAVDCAMLLVRSAVDTGLLSPFDPRPYAPRWHLHRSEEKFINIIKDDLGAEEVIAPKLGDVVVWQFGRTFSHGAIIVNNEEVVHAYYAAGLCLISRLDEDVLRFVSVGNTNFSRPVKYFDLWSKG